ncbi:MAG TPA: hypothetical protein P5171_10695 [Xanthomonadaceae bacterium]|nr:hypothetical protein [Xanthomonadaceae bacterium]HRY00586.1 hypothetical protein [Xanthomonadaceae bacterium]
MPRARKPVNDTVRIAMWSGPRNISTAMMRAWENRSDCAVIDEPFYAHYLAETGLDHPARDAVIESGETSWRKVVETLTGPAPGGKHVFYQKHMAHHLLDHIDHDWIEGLHNILLIRDPVEVISSYTKARDEVTPEDIGLPQQVELFEELTEAKGKPPTVIDAGDFLKAPEAYLRAICEDVGVPFMDCMLTWPSGPRDTDGVWAPHWYGQVQQSTGFHHPRPPGKRPELTGEAAETAEICREYYDQLHAARFVIPDASR